MPVLVAGSLMLALLLLLGGLYRRAAYRELPPERPEWVLFPKYRTQVILPRALLAAPRPTAALARVMQGHGFVPVDEAGFPPSFRSSRRLGDCSIRRLGLRLVFGEVSGYSTRCELSLAGRWLVLFDSGELWSLLDQVKRELEKPAAPRWEYGEVPGAHQHIRILNPETQQWLVRVGRRNDRFPVETNPDVSAESRALMPEVIRQLDFYFGEKQEPDPWEYAIHHCGTAANLYSPVRWTCAAGDARPAGG